MRKTPRRNSISSTRANSLSIPNGQEVFTPQAKTPASSKCEPNPTKSSNFANPPGLPAAGLPDKSQAPEADKSRAHIIAQLAALAPVNAAAVSTQFSKRTFGEVALWETASVLAEKVAAVHRGELKELEALLTSQAVALNAIFTELALRAALNIGEYLDATDRYMRLALKAQSQCRATVETLALIRNPQTVFARQANIAQGPQQVNNAEQVNNTAAASAASVDAP